MQKDMFNAHNELGGNLMERFSQLGKIFVKKQAVRKNMQDVAENNSTLN